MVARLRPIALLHQKSYPVVRRPGAISPRKLFPENDKQGGILEEEE
jgi:hypothetical protein